MKLKLPPDALFHHDVHLLVWRPRGVIDERAVNKIVRFLSDLESTSQKPFDRFIDTLAADEIDLNFKYIFHISLFRRLSYAGRPPVKSALLIANQTMAHYGKVHQMLTEGSPLKVRLFEEREAAADWLGVPLETLEY